MSGATKSRPLYIQVDPRDTVATVVNEGGLPAGTQFDSGLTLLEDIPEAHKIALVDIPAGAPVLRYGSVIGHAERAIAKGSWVHDDRMILPEPPSLENLPLATAVPSSMPALTGRHGLKDFSTTMVPSVQKIFSASPLPCSASLPPSTSPSSASRQNCFLAIPLSSTSSP